MSKSPAERVEPTKIKLLELKRRMDVAQNVKGILEDKREIILRKIDELIDQAGETRRDLQTPVTEGFSAVTDAYLKLGVVRVDSIAANTPETAEVEIDSEKVVDVEVPSVQLTEPEGRMNYGFLDTSPELDEASRKMREALIAIVEAAEIESSIYRLASELEETQRLLSALENVVIPDYDASIDYIESILEEREREEFVRLKHVKKILEEKRS